MGCERPEAPVQLQDQVLFQEERQDTRQGNCQPQANAGHQGQGHLPSVAGFLRIEERDAKNRVQDQQANRDGAKSDVCPHQPPER